MILVDLPITSVISRYVFLTIRYDTLDLSLWPQAIDDGNEYGDADEREIQWGVFWYTLLWDSTDKWTNKKIQNVQSE